MTRSTFDAMPLDDLWDLHKRVLSILEERLDQERQKLEHQLEELGRKFGGAPSDIPHRRPLQRSGNVDVSKGPPEILQSGISRADVVGQR